MQGHAQGPRFFVEGFGEVAQDVADREAAFVIPQGVAVYGGFCGNETNLNQRDPGSSRVTLSGPPEKITPLGAISRTKSIVTF